MAVYPWFSADDILKAGDYESLNAAIEDWFQYEIYQAGTPDQNVQRKPYWTVPYIDAGGTGAMVSHGAPVYVDGEFYGIAGTDVRLATLERFLEGLPFDVGRLMLLIDQNMLLADTAGTSASIVRRADEVKPGVLRRVSLALALVDPGVPVEVGGHVLVANRSAYAPWNLVYLVTREEITRLLLPRLLPYAVILIVLIITVFFALYLMKREFISPALQLVHYIRDASRDPSLPEPPLPRLWRTWARLVSDAFIRNRETTRRFRESEERLQQILNNSSSVVYVRDREERFLLVNRYFERLIGILREAVVGKQLEEVFSPETAAEFRANDMRVLDTNAAMEFEEQVELKDGVRTYISNKFPLFDTNGEIYAVCGISTDITKRKKTEEILRQSALGISQAQGKEVFNSLVMHLSKAISVDFAFIGILRDGDQIGTRALYAHDGIADNITYSLAGSPCENVNQRACEIYGYAYEAMLKNTVGDLSSGVPPYTQEDGIRLIARAGEGEHLGFEWHRKNRDGSLHWDEVHAQRVSIGGHDRILVHTREITSRKEAEEKLRASEQQYREANRRLRESEAFKTSIVENALLAVITIDAEGRIVEFNPSAMTMFGHERTLAIGRDAASVPRI